MKEDWWKGGVVSKTLREKWQRAQKEEREMGENVAPLFLSKPFVLPTNNREERGKKEDCVKKTGWIRQRRCFTIRVFSVSCKVMLFYILPGGLSRYRLYKRWVEKNCKKERKVVFSTRKRCVRTWAKERRWTSIVGLEEEELMRRIWSKSCDEST